MRSFLSAISSKLPYKSVALGNFDSMHLAHLRLFGLLCDDGCVLSITSIEPPFVLPPNRRDIYTRLPMYKIRLSSIRLMTAREFLVFLCESLPLLKKIVVGYDFYFGFNREACPSDIKSLLSLIGREDIAVEVLSKQSYDDSPIHTTLIKENIVSGNINLANALLGRFYSIEGHTVRGQGLGSSTLVPTINVKCPLFVLPKHGVYNSVIVLDGRSYSSVTFLGHRLSTDGVFCIETHVIDDFNETVVYPMKIVIKFVSRIRDNFLFSSMDDLKEQIRVDVLTAKLFFENVFLH